MNYKNWKKNTEPWSGYHAATTPNLNVFYIIEISNNLNISIKHIMYIDVKIIESLYQTIIT